MADLPLNPLVVIGVGSSFAFSGLFYHLYREKRSELQRLKEIPVFRPDPHLLRLLRATPRGRLQYVAVEGLVQADRDPLSSQFVPRCLGVIQRTSVEEHWRYWNSLSKTWNSRTTNRKETSNSVPFSLVSPGAYIADLSVRVQEPLQASGSYLERVYHKTRQVQESMSNLALQVISGEKPVAMEESEEMLRVGTALTGFGEVVLVGGQVMRLQPPQDGRQYILVPSDHKSFMDRHESTARMWRTLTAVTGLTGASLLAGLIYNLVGEKDKSK